MYLTELGKKAAKAKYEVQILSTEEKNKALKEVADALVANTDFILKQNAIDLKNGEENGMHPGLIDRLRLTPERIAAMSEGILQIIDLDDPIGEVLETTTRPNGMEIQKVRVPMGVIGIIYESRPNVTADAFALCFKTGNAVILKGGKDAIHSNKAITDTIRGALKESGITDKQEEEKKSQRTHIVQSNETLYRIAMNYYNDPNAVEKIKQANGLSSESIYVGQKLILP